MRKQITPFHVAGNFHPVNGQCKRQDMGTQTLPGMGVGRKLIYSPSGLLRHAHLPTQGPTRPTSTLPTSINGAEFIPCDTQAPRSVKPPLRVTGNPSHTPSLLFDSPLLLAVLWPGFPAADILKSLYRGCFFSISSFQGRIHLPVFIFLPVSCF